MGFFDGTRPGKPAKVGAASFDLPILYHRDDFFAVFHTADLAKVQAVMPSRRLFPVTMGGNRALVAIGAFNYIDTSIGPYGEVAVGVPVTFDRKAPAVIGALLETRYPTFGILVLHLPVTNTIARDAGRGIWGYTKFVADMRFRITPERLACELSEEGRHILTVTVKRGGLTLGDTRPFVTYSVKDGALIRTTIPARGTFRANFRGTGSSLALGDHEVAGTIRALGLSEKPVMARYYVERAGILPEGEVIETGVAPLEGYKGKDRAGAHTVAYTDEGGR